MPTQIDLFLLWWGIRGNKVSKPLAASDFEQRLVYCQLPGES